MSTQMLGAVGSARGASSLAEVFGPARADASRPASARPTARKDSGFQSVLAREATAASRAVTARDRIARRQDAQRDPEGARVIGQAIQGLLKRMGDAVSTTSAASITSAGQPNTASISQLESLKATLQQLWLQGNGSRSLADLATLALSGAAPSKTASSQANAAGAVTDASKGSTLTGLDWKSGLDALLASLKQTGVSPGTTSNPGGTDALAASEEQLTNLAKVVTDAVQAYVASQNSQPTPPPDMVYMALPAAGADSAASDADSKAGVRLVGLNSGKEDVISSMQRLVDGLQADAAPQRRGATDTQGDTPPLAQVLVNGSAAGAHAGADPLAADAARAAATAQTAHATDAVRQVQAAMSDMLDRMRGNVALDTDHMRAIIQLDPPALGRVHVTLNVNDGQRVHATFHAEDASTRDFLQQNQSDLRREFERQGYASHNVEIVFDDEPAPGGLGAGGTAPGSLGAGGTAPGSLGAGGTAPGSLGAGGNGAKTAGVPLVPQTRTV